ncbi:GEVED domain-containing protein [Deinococcus roseus]|uniref:DUF11 domain-containing protein n=1 Tax=Deinococcus roseus TaxID=392414 RepID=A0ABQ2CZ28_9DEIO|nr:GEVED domain-containing protein [Deinococcus roseus]GGJ35230.1 hypothetical protein GCM10008938_21620 [Deinococcus roseus]
MSCAAPSRSKSAGGLPWGSAELLNRFVLKFLLLLLFLGTAAHAQTTTLKITPITWDIIGLDSNNVNAGPNVFIVGARVCNIGAATATNVTATFNKTGTNNPYINLQDQSSYSVASLPAGADPDPGNTRQYFYPNPTQNTLPSNCFDFYYNGVITRTAAAYNTFQGYNITATASNASSVQTSASKQLYIEKLVSQNRNSIISFSGTTAVEVGKTYQYTLVASTATNGYEQIEHFPNFPNNQFQVLSIQTAYSAPTGQKNQIAYADACGFVYSYAGSVNKSDCQVGGTTPIVGGKAGGDPITTVYTVKILGPGNGTINNLVYDYSGSSYHYNSDYFTGGAMSFTAVYPPNLTVSKSTSTSTIWRSTTGNTGSYSITVANSSAANTGTATSVVISDPLPSGFTYASTGTLSLTGGATRTSTSNPTAGSSSPSWGSFTIPAGGSVTIPFNVTIAGSTALGTYQNGVTATYTSPDGTTGNTSTYNSASSTAEDITLKSIDCSTIYAVVGQVATQATTGTKFLTLDPNTGLFGAQIVDISGIPSVTGGFGVSPTLQKIVYVDGNGGAGYGGIARIYTTDGNTPVNTGHTIADPTAEHQVGVDKSGVLWATQWTGAKTLYRYAGTGNAVSQGSISAADSTLQTEWSSLSEGDFAFDNAGNMWFISTNTNVTPDKVTLWIVDATNRLAYKVGDFGSLVSGSFAKGAEFGPDGQLYIGVTNPGTNGNATIYKYNPGTGAFITLTSAAGALSTTYDDIQDMGSCIYPDTSDSGDAPSSYGTATHVAISTIYMGSLEDKEANQSSSNATADDTTGVNDDDGISAFPVLAAGATSYSISGIPVFNNTGTAGKLIGWIDFNKNGTFETSEGVSVAVPSSASAQTVTLSWSGLSGLTAGSTFARFRLGTDTPLTTATPTGISTNGEVEDYALSIINNTDYSDAPSGYGSASHNIVPTVRLGSVAPDAEVTAASSSNADGDDTSGTDDEEAISSFPLLTTASTTYALNNITVLNNSGTTGKLIGWIDFNQNGTFETTEAASVNVNSSASTQSVSLSWTGLSGLVAGTTYVRLRISSDATLTTSTPTGLKTNGEVEDYTMTIQAVDYGDAPSSYLSASHVISSNLRLGSVLADAESGMQNSATANGDDLAGTDDEDALSGTVNVSALGTFTLSNIGVTNTTGSTARLVGWIDFNRNGTFDSATEAAIATINNGATTATLSWMLPADLQGGASFLRLRITTDSTIATGTASTSVPTGLASNGEMEDHPVNLNFYTLSGTVFTDVNYGGGAGRDYATASSSATASGFAAGSMARSGATVELYSSTGTYIGNATTNASGQYSFLVAAGSYQIRVVNSTVTSARTGYVAGLLPVQTYRTSGSTGTAVAVTNKVGGEDPTQVDAAANTTSTLAVLNAVAGQEVQSLTPVTVSTANVTGLDFGFNFDTIVNTNNAGQGSLRQFVLNANAMGNESLLAQSGNRKKLDNTNESLPAGKETSIFMIPAANLTASVGVITLSSTVQFTGTNAVNTILDGTTQTVNIADGNSGQLGTGGTVGIGPDLIAGNSDDTVLNRIYRPEIEIKSLTGSIAGMGLQLSASNITVRGVSVYGFGSAANADNNANIQIDNDYTSTLIEQNFLGISATRSTFDCSATAGTAVATGSGDNIRSIGGDSGTVQYNLIGCAAGKGFGVENSSTGWQILGNEIRGNAIGNMHLDGVDLENGNTGTATVRGNLIASNWGVGVDSYSGLGSNTTEYNTIENNGIGTSGGSPLEDSGVRIYGTGSTVRYNIIRNNVGSGVMVQASSSGNTITQNSIYGNGKIGIDLLNSTDDVTKGTSPFVTLNDLNDADTGANGLLNYPVFAAATLVGSNLEVTGYARPGATIELFLSDSDASSFGEGQTYLGTVTEGCSTVSSTCLAVDSDGTTGTYGSAAVNGILQGTDSTNKFKFTLPLSSLKTTVANGNKLTATATLSSNTSEFSGQVTVLAQISGNVFEDVNYGGGAGRNYSTSNTSATASGFTSGAILRSGVTVELYSSTGTYISNTTTDSAGNYVFSVAAGSYQIRVVNSTVSSTRTGWVNTLRPVQTYRTNGSTGTAVAVTNKVGGEDPTQVDAAANTTSTLAVLNAVANQEVQSLTPVTVSTASISGLDFGFNFDTIVNTNDAGQGSMAQFISNANALGNESLLAQSGNRKDLSNINQSLPSGKETSIFMIPAANLTSGVALIDLSVASDPALPAFSGSNATNTILDGTTQTVNIGDTNSGVLGTGGTVGTGNDGLQGTSDDAALPQVYKPEVQITGRFGINGLSVTAGTITLRGMAIKGFGQSSINSDHGDIYVAGASNLTVEGMVIGTSASSFTDPGAGLRSSNGLVFWSGAVSNTTLQNNLIGFTERRGIAATGTTLQLDTLLIQQNEIRSTNRLGTTQGGGIELNPDYSPSGTYHRAITIKQNLITATGAGDSGIELGYTPTDTIKRIEDNTISNNAYGGISLSLDTTSGTATHNTSTVRDYLLHNVITGNQTGIQIYATGTIAALENKTISQNAIYDNTALGIDLKLDGVTGNDGLLTAAQPNRLIDYPIITSSVLTGNSLQLQGVVGGNLPSNAVPTPSNSTFAGATLEFFIADNSPANQDGVVLLSDGRSKPHGEGAIYIGQGTADASGNFNVTLSLSASQVTALGTATNVTATATNASGSTSEFGPVYLYRQVSGTVFEDVNYGGGLGRNYGTSNTSAQNGGSGFAAGAIGRAGVTLEVYDSTGTPVDLDPSTSGTQNNVTTTAGGNYSIGLFEGNYQIRVVNSTVSSTRTGWVNTLMPVQTYRTNASTGSAVAVTSKVGGEDPAQVDAAANTTSTLATLNAVANQEVQSLSSVNLTAGNVSGVDFGFNFDTIVNTSDAGQGSLRQFVLNANALGNESLLAQSGNRKKLDNTNESLPAGKETSIFMVPQPASPPTSWAATITLTTTVQFTGANAVNTILDGTTQTVNIGDTNTGQLGTGGTVGTGVDAILGNADDTVLNKIYKPEIEIKSLTGNIAGMGLQVSANTITLRGLSIYGFGTAVNSSNHANIHLDDGFTNAVIEQNFVGISATRSSFNCPTGGATGTGDNIRSLGADNGTIQNNLIGCNASKGIGLENSSTGWQILGNEIRGNAIGNPNLDGIDIENGSSGNVTVRGNLVAYNAGVGVDTHIGMGGNTISQNTIEFNGAGTGASLEDSGIRVYGPGNTIQYNIIRSNTGSGVMVEPTSTGNVISKNSIYSNGKIGIDLMTSTDTEKSGTAPYVTLNDSGDADTGGNTLLNFPVFATATLQGGNLTITGYARPGATIELFLANPDPSGFGEGQTYLGTFTEGCSTVSSTCLAVDSDSATGSYGPSSVNGILQGQDSTSRFQFVVPVSGLLATVNLGDQLTATATLSSNTSEFSGLVTVSIAGFSVSGNVYEDVQPNGSFEPTENWTAGSTVYVHLIQSGNVVATTTVGAGTGAFTFSNVNAGTYTLAVSSVSGTVGNPAPGITAPAGWLYINPADGSRQLDVASAVTGQNFGLYHGSRVTGRVFYDDAFGAASVADESKANNGIQDLSEKGASGVTVRATAGVNTVSATTSATGDFQMYLPHAQFGGQTVVIGHAAQPATGNNTGNVAPITLATTLNDGLAASRSYSNASGQTYGTYYFGILHSSSWRPDQSGTTSSPGIIDYTHAYTPETLGNLAFSTAGNLFYGVFGDTNCDGTFSDTEKASNLLVSPIHVGYSWPRLSDGSFKPCEFHVQVNVPSNLAANSVDRVKVKAELTWQNNSSVKDPLYLLDTTTTRTLANGGKLSLTKGLRNVTQGETSYTVSNGGKVGEVIEYKITFTNSGDTVITDIVLGDNVPYFTDMVQNVYGATGEMELHCPSGSVVNVNLGQTSVIDLPLNLPTSCNITQMAPGDFGYFLYRVQIR